MKSDPAPSPEKVAAGLRRARIILYLVVGLVMAVNLAIILRMILGPERH